VRPHSALNDQSPRTFVIIWSPSAASASTPWPANHTLADVVRSAAAANPEPGQLFVRPSAAVKGAAAKLVSEGTSIEDDPSVCERLSLELSELPTAGKSGFNRIMQLETQLSVGLISRGRSIAVMLLLGVVGSGGYMPANAEGPADRLLCCLANRPCCPTQKCCSMSDNGQCPLMHQHSVAER